jgi:ABC-type sugar transport system substrate-binding protein
MLLVRAVYRQLGGEPTYAAQVVAAIAAGDLGATVATRPGDQGSLRHAMTAMQQMLAKNSRQHTNATGRNSEPRP